MRRTLVLLLTAVAFLGMVAPGAYAQAPAAPAAPTPTFRITGFIDEVITYANNISGFDFDLHRKDYTFYGRTRGRFDIVGEYGKAKAVLGLELDFVYGMSGSTNTNIGTAFGSAAGAAGAVNVIQGAGADGSTSLNTDVRGILEVKWLYTEFEVPYIPLPTIARIGLQPFGAAATISKIAYATGDFGGVNFVTTITPNIKLVNTFVMLEEGLAGRQQATGSQITNGASPVFNTGQPGTAGANGNFLGVPPLQLRGDDWAIIIAPEITPIRGVDIKPMFSYLLVSDTTSASARQGRGGIVATTWFQNTCSPTVIPGVANSGLAWQNGPACAGNNASGTWRKGIEENRITIGSDARIRLGAFSLDPTVYYQFGNRTLVAPSDGSMPVQFLQAGVTPGHKYYSNLSAWFADIRAGYQIGPLLLEGMGMFTTGNSARDTTLKTVKYYQVLDTDTGYLADWGSQLTALGIDFAGALFGGGTGVNAYPGNTVGWDKYGRIQLGARGTYAWTPAFSMYGGYNAHWVPQAIQKNALPLASGGLIPIFTGQEAKAQSNYVGSEIFAGLTWRFAPGLALDSAGGYLWTGGAFDALTNPAQGPRDAKNVYVLTSRIRFSF